MNLKLPKALRRIVRVSQFWQDNYILLREFKNFRRVAVMAVFFTVLSAVFEGLTLGLLLSFLQSLTRPKRSSDKHRN